MLHIRGVQKICLRDKKGVDGLRRSELQLRSALDIDQPGVFLQFNRVVVVESANSIFTAIWQNEGINHDAEDNGLIQTILGIRIGIAVCRAPADEHGGENNSEQLVNW